MVQWIYNSRGGQEAKSEVLAETAEIAAGHEDRTSQR
jgi:hypothetical protein